MRLKDLKVIAIIITLFFMSFVISFFYEGMITLPTEGDSLTYHIPIAQSILKGQIFKPNFYLGYYPSNAETLLSLFLLLHIPLNIFNVFGWILLFFALLFLGKSFGLKYELSIVYSISICMVHGMIRWLNTQVIDIWLALFFVLSLLLLQTIKNNKKHFLYLGIVFGLLIGTKYSGPLFALVLLIIYFKQIKNKLTLINVLLFFTPVIFLGGFWYIRNILLVHNPVYPQPLLSLSGMPKWDIFHVQVWKATLFYPQKMINAYIAEYMIWPLLLLPIIGVIFYMIFKKKVISQGIKELLAIGICNFVIYLFLPTSSEYNIIVSSFRYSYPSLIPLMLSMFLFFQNIKKESYLILATFSNIALLPSLTYRPKLVIPLFIFIILLYNWKGVRSLIEGK
jgi:hypothetical protein